MGEFIQLHRTFRELKPSQEDFERDSFSSLSAPNTSMGWDDLLNEFRVVILAEAGAGKTEEIRHIAQQLHREGKSAFFLRLEHVSKDFEDAFEKEGGTFEEFEAWLKSNAEGWLLLDSVDEARLRDPKDFECAIRKLARKLKGALQRVHIIITSRVSAWRPKTDLALCKNELPYDIPENKDAEKTEIREQSSQKTLVSETEPYTIVTLEDLSVNQVRDYAKVRGVQNIEGLIEAIERANARQYTTRPQDLEELIAIWNEDQRIGSPMDFLEKCVERRLKERDQDRKDKFNLSQDKLREGAKRIAVAATLTKNSDIRVPDGSSNTKGIPIEDILSDWDPKEQSTLLDCPIFDEAIYGTVRFHHRTVREFLTAEYLADLLKNGNSRRQIEELFFANQYGLVWVVRPTMRPILSWLAALNAEIAKCLCEIAPEVLLTGGDFKKLSLEIRKSVFKHVCEHQLTYWHSLYLIYPEIHQLVGSELAEDIRQQFKKNATNLFLPELLLNLVWHGRMHVLLPEAKQYALRPDVMKTMQEPMAKWDMVQSKTLRNARIAAFNAVKVIGSAQDIQEVREKFLAEGDEIKRDLLQCLIEDLEPTANNIQWILACLKKLEPAKEFKFSRLSNELETFVHRINDEKDLILWVQELNTLFDAEHMPEQSRYELPYQVPAKCGGLLRPAARAVIKLIENRSQLALQEDVLAILHKLAGFDEYDNAYYYHDKLAQRLGGEVNESVSLQLASAVTAWPELKRLQFWYEVTRVKSYLKFSWCINSRYLGKFDASDFDYFIQQIAEQNALDDKELALLIAFFLYRDHGAGKLDQLNKAVAICEKLEERLQNCLNPPKDEWEQKRIAKEQEKTKNREDWRSALKTPEVIEKLRHNGLEPGQISRYQHHLYQCMQEKNRASGRWSLDGNWQCLIEEFGEDVARAFRDGAVKFWRGYRPTLQSEGTKGNSTSWGVIFGFVGLQIEANETENWVETLNEDEAQIACRYAICQFERPKWFCSLISAFYPILSPILLKEIRYKASSKDDLHNCVSGMYYCNGDEEKITENSSRWTYSGTKLPWFEDFSRSCYGILKDTEHGSMRNVKSILWDLLYSSISDTEIAILAELKCVSAPSQEHLALWYAVWMSVQPEKALSTLEKHLESLPSPSESTEFARNFIPDLIGDAHHGLETIASTPRIAFKMPQTLKQLFILMNTYIVPKEDDYEYSVCRRVGARPESARDYIIELIQNIPGKEAFAALNEIAQKYPGDHWLTRSAKIKAETDADLPEWSAKDVKDFYKLQSRTPKTHQELAELAYWRLLDLKDELEKNDDCIAKTFQRVENEPEMRNCIAHELHKIANGRYIIAQEEEFADGKRTDIRFRAVDIAPVPVELKLAQNWSGSELFERMENQLCGDYLRESKRGIFLLVYQGQDDKRKSWTKARLNFDALIKKLENYWRDTLSEKYPNIEQVEVVGIDLTKYFRKGDAR